MFENALFQWLGTIVASGGIGAAITYFATFRSNARKAAAEATEKSSYIMYEQDFLNNSVSFDAMRNNN